MKSIGPQDVLEPGTKIVVKSATGTIIGGEWKRDQFGLPIYVHKVNLTSRFHYRVANRRVYKAINETKDVNYASISVV